MLVVATRPAQWTIRHHKWDFSGPFTHSTIDLSFCSAHYCVWWLAEMEMAKIIPATIGNCFQ
jgi:hypothetical protein